MLEIKGLDKRYTVADETTVALDSVTLTLPDNGLVLVTGKNGSGKTTFLNMLGLIDTPDDGSILVDGREIVGLADREADGYRKNSVSYIFQTMNLLSTLTAKENLLLCGVDGEKATEVLTDIGLEDCIDKLPSQMSQGQIQKVSIIRAMLGDTAILLADEPTSALDKDSKTDVAQLLTKAALDKLVVVVTHDMQLFDRADTVIEFEDGRASVTHSTVETRTETVSAEAVKHPDRTAKHTYRYLFVSAMRASRKKVISTIVIAILFLVMFVCVNLLMSLPYGNEPIYMSMAKYYEKSKYSYVLVDSQVDGAPRNSPLSISQFDYGILYGGTWSFSQTPLYYTGGLGCVNVVQSDAIVGKTDGKIPEGKREIAITDYCADLLIYYYGYEDYADVLDRAYLTLEFDGAGICDVKVVGITHTSKEDFASLKTVYPDDMGKAEFYYRNGVLRSLSDSQVASHTDKEAIKFKAECEYSLACVYMEAGFDDDIAKSMSFVKGASVNMSNSVSSMNVKRLSSIQESDYQKDVYTLNDGRGAYVRLSQVISANQLYSVIKDSADEQQRRSAIFDFVTSIDVSQVKLQYGSKNEAKTVQVAGFVDDFGKLSGWSIFLDDSSADEFFQECIDYYLSENKLTYYVKTSNVEEVFQLLVDREGECYFPAVNTFAAISNAVTVLLLVSVIGAAVLLVFVIALLFNDCAYYFKNNMRDFAVLKALGVPMRKLAFTSMIRYLIATVTALAVSLIIAPIVIAAVNTFAAKPYAFAWFTFSPLGVLLNIALTVAVISIAFCFQYRIMKRRSLGSLLK